jgi:mannosyltransferase OCH1-like enzyme
MIPKKFHRLWFGPNPMPEKYVEYGRQWEEMNPGWTLIDWTDETIPEIINKNIWDAIGQWPKSSIRMESNRAIAVQRADVVSYELIWRYGGVYLNADIQPLRPIEELLEETGDRAFAAYEGEYNGKAFLVNAVLGGPAEHPCWRECVDELPGRYLTMITSPMEMTTGPHLITDLYDRRWRKQDNFIALPRDYFNPVHFGEIEAGQDASDRVEWAKSLGAYGLHHWGHREDQGQYDR